MISRKYPSTRLRRLRQSESIIKLTSECILSKDDLIQPVFVKEGLHDKEPIESMPGIFRFGEESVLKEIREIDDLVPLIFLTAKTLKEDVLKGFKLGADDYLTKPFDSEVLLAKIKSILGRRMIKEVADTVETQFKIGNFSLDTKLRLLIYLDQKPIKLSPKENQLLRLLTIHINDLLPRDQALSKIWRDDNYFTSRSMDVYIAKLRKYLKSDEHVEILNIHGEGFRLIDKS